MRKLTKNGVALFVGVVALAATAGMAQATETRFAVQDASANDKMVVTDQGFVGVGLGTGVLPAMPVQIKGNTIGNATIEIGYIGNASYSKFNAPTLQFTRNNLSTDNLGIPKNTDRLGFINFGAVVGGAYRQGAQMNAIADSATWSSTSFPASFTFSTADAASTFAVERMRITSGGNIGVGASAPTQKLEVNGGVRLNPISPVVKPSCTTANRGTMWFTQGTTDVLEVCASVSGGTPIWRAVTLQ